MLVIFATSFLSSAPSRAAESNETPFISVTKTSAEGGSNDAISFRLTVMYDTTNVGAAVKYSKYANKTSADAEPSTNKSDGERIKETLFRSEDGQGIVIYDFTLKNGQRLDVFDSAMDTVTAGGEEVNGWGHSNWTYELEIVGDEAASSDDIAMTTTIDNKIADTVTGPFTEGELNTVSRVQIAVDASSATVGSADDESAGSQVDDPSAGAEEGDQSASSGAVVKDRVQAQQSSVIRVSESNSIRGIPVSTGSMDTMAVAMAIVVIVCAAGCVFMLYRRRYE